MVSAWFEMKLDSFSPYRVKLEYKWVKSGESEYALGLWVDGDFMGLIGLPITKDDKLWLSFGFKNNWLIKEVEKCE